MKRIIGGKQYDTEKARELGVWTSTWDHKSWHYESEALYVKRTGEYFLHGKGGPMSKYSKSMGNNEWSGGEQIIPLSLDKAREWAEEHMSADEYEEAFGLPDEDAEDVTLSIRIPAALNAAIREKAAEKKISLSEYIRTVLENATDSEIVFSPKP